MARATDVRPTVRPESTAGAGSTDVVRTNCPDDPDLLVLREDDPVVRRHVHPREER